MFTSLITCAVFKGKIQDVLIYYLTEKKLRERKLQRNLDNWSKGKLVKEHEISLSGAVCWKNVDHYSLVLSVIAAGLRYQEHIAAPGL